MSTYSPGADITLDFDLELTDQADWVRVRVEDEAGELVASTETSLVSVEVGAGKARVTVLANANRITPATSGHRLVILTYAAAAEFAGEKVLEADYALRTGPSLTLQVDSFQTYNEAVMNGREISDIAAFQQAAREQRIVALKDAWLALVKLRYDINNEADQTRLRDVPWRHAWDLSELTASEFAGLDTRFQRALRRAQIIEANEILSGGGAARRRMDGILSSTIGETSQMFRTGKPVDYPVSPRALKELRGYVSFSVRLARGA